MDGTVEAVFTTPERNAPPEPRESVRAVAGQGLRGDRYFRPADEPGPGCELTLIEAEALEAAARDYDVDVPPGAHRRNVVTRGVPLNHLVDRTFRVGDALVRGRGLCEPCSHMESLAVDGAREALVHRGGLEADIVESGVVAPGDPVTTE